MVHFTTQHLTMKVHEALGILHVELKHVANLKLLKKKHAECFERVGVDKKRVDLALAILTKLHHMATKKMVTNAASSIVNMFKKTSESETNKLKSPPILWISPCEYVRGCTKSWFTKQFGVEHKITLPPRPAPDQLYKSDLDLSFRVREKFGVFKRYSTTKLKKCDGHLITKISMNDIDDGFVDMFPMQGVLPKEVVFPKPKPGLYNFLHMGVTKRDGGGERGNLYVRVTEA